MAHRGASDEAPENTLPAFARALERGCQVLECDVHPSRDGVMAVIHDATMDRTTDARGAVADLDWSAIAGADAGYARRFGSRFRGARVPRLEQVFELAHGRAEVMVEIKTAAGVTSAAVATRVLEIAADARLLDAIGVISMSAAVVRRVRAASPATTTGIVFRRRQRRGLVATAVACGADFLIAPAGTLETRAPLCQQARDCGLRLGAYGIVSTSQLGRLARLGVESLAADDPAAMLGALPGIGS